MSSEPPHVEWSEPMDPEAWRDPPRGIEFREPIVAITPHDDGARVILESGREFIVTPTR